jgi:hypothetical protein
MPPQNPVALIPEESELAEQTFIMKVTIQPPRATVCHENREQTHEISDTGGLCSTYLLLPHIQA